MNERNCRTTVIVLLIITMLLCSSCAAYADMGPKPSTIVHVHGIEGEYYATLLSEASGSGPWHTDVSFDDIKGWGDYYTKEAWNILKSFEDSDGFHFLGFMDVCSGEDSFSWTYMRPEVFKILLYDCSSNAFYCSEILESYAFDSEYDVVCSDAAGESLRLQVSKTHNVKEKLAALAFRIAATIVIELVIAYLFGLREKKQIACICLVNLATQILLNLVLTYPAVLMMYIIRYSLIEILIIVIEPVLLTKLFRRHFTSVSAKKVYYYSVIANLSSFTLGYLISLQFPFLFK